MRLLPEHLDLTRRPLGRRPAACPLNSVQVFEDLVAANRPYADSFKLRGLAPRAARALAVVTCIDSRIDPLQMMGLAAGDAMILRNAGARVTEDVLRSLVLAVNLLGVDRVCVVQHTDCQMSLTSNDELVATLERIRGVDASGWDFLAIDDQEMTLAMDLERIRSCPLLPSDLPVVGFVYDVETGLLRQLEG